MIYKRNAFMHDYCMTQANHIAAMRGVPFQDAFDFVYKVARERYRPVRGTIIRTKSPGNLAIEQVDVLSFLENNRDKVIAPSGSLYKPTSQQASIIADMIKDKMQERKELKSKQFKASTEALRNLFMYQQTSVKITCNSMPGQFGSPFNVMYDKGGYNSITSTARSMIGLAIATTEQLLGANFSWFCEEDLVNFILVVLEHAPKEEELNRIMTKYRLQVPTVDMLFEYYKDLAQIYSPNHEFQHTRHLLSSLKQHEITFLYYYCNLRHIIWNNETVFRAYIKHLFEYTQTKFEPATVDDLYSYDESIIVLTTVVFANEFEGLSMEDIHSNEARLSKLVFLCGMLEGKLAQLDDLFKAFIDVPVIAPNIPKKTATLRNTVIISDTDSVIFTAADWDRWYRGETDNITHEAYQITALVIYWLHITIRNIMRVFSITNCVAEENWSTLAMKNEFLYPIMLLYDIRKTYVGIVAVQEGNILATPKADIKGQTLKGSMFCEATRDFTESFIENDVLFKSMQDKLSAAELIEQVVRFELRIAKSIDEGSCEFFKITSIKNEAEYKNPDSTSVIRAWRFWEQVFSKEYGAILPPAKVQIFPALRVTDKYLQWLEQYPKIHKRMLKYLESNKHIPNNLITNPLIDRVPVELIPLINKRSIIHHNVQPVYSVLERVSIALGGRKEELLFSDIYGVDPIDDLSQ